MGSSPYAAKYTFSTCTWQGTVKMALSTGLMLLRNNAPPPPQFFLQVQRLVDSANSRFWTGSPRTHSSSKHLNPPPCATYGLQDWVGQAHTYTGRKRLNIAGSRICQISFLLLSLNCSLARITIAHINRVEKWLCILALHYKWLVHPRNHFIYSRLREKERKCFPLILR